MFITFEMSALDDYYCTSKAHTVFGIFSSNLIGLLRVLIFAGLQFFI